MTFSRSFRSQTWFVHMTDGSIEVMDGRLVERAFASCMLDGQTPVRAIDTHVWSTLAEEAGLAPAGQGALRGKARFDAAAIEKSSWHAGADVDAKKLDGRRGRTAAILAVGMLAGLVLLFGTHLASAFAPTTGPQARAACLLPMPTTLVTNEAQPARRSTGRLTFEQSKRLSENDRWRDIGTERERVRQQAARRNAPAR